MAWDSLSDNKSLQRIQLFPSNELQSLKLKKVVEKENIYKIKIKCNVYQDYIIGQVFPFTKKGEKNKKKKRSSFSIFTEFDLVSPLDVPEEKGVT